jgi:hypothetical protein
MRRRTHRVELSGEDVGVCGDDDDAREESDRAPCDAEVIPRLLPERHLVSLSRWVLTHEHDNNLMLI